MACYTIGSLMRWKGHNAFSKISKRRSKVNIKTFKQASIEKQVASRWYDDGECHRHYQYHYENGWVSIMHFTPMFWCANGCCIPCFTDVHICGIDGHALSYSPKEETYSIRRWLNYGNVCCVFTIIFTNSGMVLWWVISTIALIMPESRGEIAYICR